MGFLITFGFLSLIYIISVIFISPIFVGVFDLLNRRSRERSLSSPTGQRSPGGTIQVQFGNKRTVPVQVAR